MTKIDFIKKEDRYFLKIFYKEEFIGIISNENRILKRERNENLYDDIDGKIKNIHIVHNNTIHYKSFKTGNILYYNFSESDESRLDAIKIAGGQKSIEIEVDKKDFVKLKLKYS